jgi:hypothetical protein
MTDTSSVEKCSRSGDLLAFMYGEANERESQDFKRHLVVCGHCRADLSTFGDVRKSIGLWREHAMSIAEPIAADLKLVPAFQAPPSIATNSWFERIREFFAVSPLWARGAAALATILVAVFLFVAVARFFRSNETPVAQQNEKAAPIAPTTPVPTPGGNGTVERVNPEPESNAADPSSPKPVIRKKNNSGNVLANRRKEVIRKQPVLTDEERSQLSDLLIAERDSEDSVPRLYDLITESN